MKTYLVSKYGKTFEIFHCLFEVDPEPVENDQNGFSNYRIKKVIHGNDDLVFEDYDGYFKWRWEYSKMKNHALYKEGLRGFELAEFEDDEAALTWFRLNYGG